LEVGIGAVTSDRVPDSFVRTSSTVVLMLLTCSLLGAAMMPSLGSKVTAQGQHPVRDNLLTRILPLSLQPHWLLCELMWYALKAWSSSSAQRCSRGAWCYPSLPMAQVSLSWIRWLRRNTECYALGYAQIHSFSYVVSLRLRFTHGIRAVTQVEDRLADQNWSCMSERPDSSSVLKKRRLR